MRWSIVSVIFRREVRDQLRDRRTLFMIFVLPILLYPLLGIGIAQLSMAFEQKPRTVVVVGAEFLPESPRLLNPRRDGFDPSLFISPVEADRLIVQPAAVGGPWSDPDGRRQGLKAGFADAVVLIPPDVRERLEDVGSAGMRIAYDSADERSQITYLRVREVLAQWNDAIVSGRLKHDHKPSTYTEPVQVKAEDVATKEEAGGSVWARLFPFLLVMMALTGAFYPAVDLCAGEKERGTMETLLISPASRAEIVLGKFFTVMLASIATALLNLVSMGLTGAILARQVSAMAPAGGRRAAMMALSAPSLHSAFWMIVLLIPLSVFFSAICLALAVLAKSMKEGQYYMTPLYLIALPLIFLSLAPGIELNLFYSLVPITGVSLLLKALMLGDYDVARRYFLAVLVPTVVYGGFALSWAIDQFQREGVLFREAERFELKTWVRHMFRDKEATPTAGEALFCFALMLTSAWFMFGVLNPSVASMAVGQVAFILTPPLAMAFLLTADPRRTLRLYWPKGRYLVLAVGLALAVNPLVSELRVLVEYFFPITDSMKAALNELMGKMPSAWTALLLLAVVPAICEEVAFRGYILSGLERTYKPLTAVLLSAFLFGFLHVLLSLFQQLFNATLLGIILGLLAIRSRSLLPGIIFHAINNSAVLLRAYPARDFVGPHMAAAIERLHLNDWLYRDPAQNLYRWPWLVLGAALSAAMLVVLFRSDRGEGTYQESARESLADPVLTH